MILLLCLLLAYLLGSVPFGLLVGRYWLGLDVRQQGSGNIGMTNVLRVGGKGPGALTFLLDLGKGWLAVEIARFALQNSSTSLPLGILALVGSLAILGHVFPIYLSFHGGKGISTLLGSLLAVYWPLLLVALATWLSIFAWKRISSLSALCMLCVLPVASLILPGLTEASPSWDLTLLYFFISVLLVYCHRDNLRRLRAGTEGVLRTPSSPSEQSP